MFRVGGLDKSPVFVLRHHDEGRLDFDIIVSLRKEEEMKILITGGCGFIGGHLCELLVKNF